MNDIQGYAVFFFPQALEALGGPIKAYLRGEAGAEHVLCREVDTGGTFIKMVLDGRTPDGSAVELELMVPGSMVRMIMSARSEEAFGFGPRVQSKVPAEKIVAEPEERPRRPAAATRKAASNRRSRRPDKDGK